MSYSPKLTSNFNDTKNRSNIVSCSGMCSFCTEDCLGTCELGLAAVRGSQTVYPTNTGTNQVASEKNYPIDYSHFNINGHCFGTHGVRPNYEDATIYNVKLERRYGRDNEVKIALPFMLPAVIKLNWKDYFAGAAMAGVCAVIGEGCPSKDPNLEYTDGKITKFEMLGEMFDAFNKYYRGYGQIILQCNVEDDMQGLPEYAIKNHGCQAIEFKFGQSAKGVQPARICKGGYEEALKKQASGLIVRPDPSTPEMKKKFEEGCCPNFYAYDRLPLWDTKFMVNRVKELKAMGLKNVYFKMAGYDPKDLETVLRIAAMAGVDMVTFDGAGGGSGYSPNKMMNEWAYPTVCMEVAVADIVNKLEDEGLEMPAITITGGIATEDQAYKAIALGDGHITAIGLCRAAMAAAMSGKKIGDMIKAGDIPERYKQYGNTVQEIFADLADLRYIYGKEADNFPTGAVGVFSYLNKMAFGLQHFAALNRKFDIELADSSDLIPLTRDARDLLNGEWFDF